MANLTYKKMIYRTDPDIPRLMSVFRLPEISQFYSIDAENYFSYVTNTTDVYFYKVYNGTNLIGVTHLEKQDRTLSMSIMVLPEFQKLGMGTQILKDITANRLGLDFDRIEVSIDEKNTASRTLFEHTGFTVISRDEELVNYVYQRES